MAGKNYRDLMAWQKAMDLVIAVYRVSARFPREELYGLSSQLRKAAVSVPSNIAEGQGRGTKKEFARFLRIAHGSIREVETQTLIAARLTYLNATLAEEVLTLAASAGRLVAGLINSLRREDGQS